MPPWFFFSYARDDNDDKLEKFYADLRKEFLLAKQLAPEDVGFLDRSNIKVGDVWSEKLKDALRTCKVLVSICSPTYFNREYCGKEFQVCLDRQAGAGKSSTALIPVLWGMPSASVHPAMKKFQYTHKSIPAIYSQEGLFYMMKLNHHKDDYETFVTRLGRAIVDAGTNNPLPEIANLPSLDKIVNPFKSPVKTAGSNSRNAFFTYVAAGPNELNRQALERYGEGGREWRPFYPDYSDSVGDVAMAASAKQKLFYSEFAIDNDLVKRIKEAEDNRQIVILLVDPWTIRVKSYRDLMREYDKINFENCAVLVAWNSPDQETDAERKLLLEELRSTFKFRAKVKRSIYYCESISSSRDLRSTLTKTLAKLRNSLIEASTPQQRIKDPDLTKNALSQGIALNAHPIVSGPGENSE